MKTRPITTILALSMLLIAGAGAQTINWVSTASTAPLGTKHFLSDGTAMPSGFTFQLGYFDAGFNAADANTWAGNWHALDTTAYNGSTTSNFPFLGFNFQKASTVTSATASFTGKQGYIWGFNNLSLMGQPGGEAIIFTNPVWSFPDPNNPIADNWSVSLSSSVLFGSVDKNVATAGGVLTGAGDISAPKAANTFHVQTATWGAAPVPEPSTIATLALGGLVALRRRRRS